MFNPHHLKPEVPDSLHTDTEVYKRCHWGGRRWDNVPGKVYIKCNVYFYTRWPTLLLLKRLNQASFILDDVYEAVQASCTDWQGFTGLFSTYVSCHLGPRANMLPIWSGCQATVLGVMVADRVVYTEHISNHLGSNLSTEFLGPHLRPPWRPRRRLLVPCCLWCVGVSWAGFAKFK